MNPESIPEELEAKFKEDPLLKAAFEGLTPGRQRGYILHFSQPKQEKIFFRMQWINTNSLVNSFAC